jgi:hypothetical protein
VDDHGDHYTIDVGAVRDIIVGDQFTLYDHPEPSETSSHLGISVVRAVHPFYSELEPLSAPSRLELLKPIFALQTKAGSQHDLPVYVAEGSGLVFIFEGLAQQLYHVQPDRPKILLVEKEQAALNVDLEHNKVVFEIRGPDERVLGERVVDELTRVSGYWQRIPSSVELDTGKLLPVLDAAIHFHRHLCRTDQKHILRNKVHFVFTEVIHADQKFDDDLNPVIEPTGDNLNKDGIIRLTSAVPATAGMYGIKIINDTAAPLYGALFYFNTNDLSISTCLSCTAIETFINPRFGRTTQPVKFRQPLSR